MTHIHEKSGLEFEVGEYRDVDGGKTYDITIISYWKDAEVEGELETSPVELVNYYFGGYDEETTDRFIDRWLANRAKEISVLQAARDYMDAYLVTNRDVLTYPTISHLEQALTECCDLLKDRSWRLTPKYDKEWFEAEKIKKVLNDCMDAPGDTTIKIVVERAGKTTTADLYDHAALVTSLYESLEYFQSEL